MANRTAYGTPLTFPGSGNTRKAMILGGAVQLIAADLALNSIIGLFKVPKGFNLTGISGYFPSLDSNASKTLQFTLGDALSWNRIVNTSTLGQAGGALTNSAMQQGAFGYNYPADTEIEMIVTAAAATPAPGTIYFYQHGYFDL